MCDNNSKPKLYNDQVTFKWNGQDVPMPGPYQQIPSGIPVGSSAYKKIMRHRKHDRRAKSIAKLDASDDQISWSSLGLRSTEEVKEVEHAAQNSSTQLANGWSVPQYTVATRYYKARLAKPTLTHQFENIEIEAAKFISLWESRGYATLRGPIGTAKCTFGLCTWIFSGDLPQIRQLIDDEIFKETEKTPCYHVRRRIIQFIALSPYENVCVQFTGFVGSPKSNVSKQLFVRALQHLDSVIPAFQSGEDEYDGYIDVCPEFQTGDKGFLTTWKSNVMFSVFEDAKKYVTDQLTQFFSKYGRVILCVAIGAVVSVIAFAILTPTLARLVTRWLMGDEIDDSLPEHQGKEDYIPVLSDITHALTKYMNGPMGNVNVWASELSKSGAQLRNIEYLMMFVVTKFSTVVDYVSMKIYKVPFFESSRHVLWAQTELLNLTMELKALTSTQLTRASSTRVVAIYTELAKMSQIYAGMGPIGLSAKMAVENVIRSHKSSYDSAMQSVYAPTTRVEPAWVHILGPPNMGKSTFSYALAATVHKHLYGSFDEADVYPVNEANEFWDGFYGQKVIFVDEHLAKKDVETRAKLATEMIHVVNSMPHPIVSASLDDKGKHWIDCDLVITTNNDCPYPSELGLKDPNAYYRRRSLVLELVEREGDSYSFRLHPILPPSGSSSNFVHIENGGQVTQRVLDIIAAKRSDFAKLKGKTTTPEPYGTVDSSAFRLVGGAVKPQPKAFKLSVREQRSNNPEHQAGESDDDEPLIEVEEEDKPRRKRLNESIRIDGQEFASFAYKGKPVPQPGILMENCAAYDAYLNPLKTKKINFNAYATHGNLGQYIANATANLPYSHGIQIHGVSVSQKDKAYQWMSGWMYPYHQTGVDLSPVEFFNVFPLHFVVADTPYNSQGWAKACKEKGIPHLKLEWLLEVCQHKLTYGDLIRMIDGVIAPKDHLMHRITANSRVFLAKWFATSTMLYSLFNVEELEHIAKHAPDILPSGLTNYNHAFISMRAIWESKYGLSREIIDKLRDPKWVLIGTLGLAALATIAVSIYKWITSSGLNIKEEIELQSDNKHMNNTLKKTLRANRRQRNKKQTVVVESQSDDQQVEFHALNMGMTDKVANNIEHIVFHYDDGSTASQFCLFLYGNKMVTARHPFFRTDKKVVTLTFSFATTMPYKAEFSSLSCKFDPKRDLAFVTVKNFPVMFANITGQGYLKSKEARPTPGTLGATRISFTPEGALHLIQGGAITDYNGPTGITDQIQVEGCIKFPVGGAKGMCGLAYVFDNTKVSFIAGIHTAGTDTFSVVAPLFVEDLQYFETPVEQQAYEPIELAGFVLPDLALLREIKPSAKEFTVVDKPSPCPLGMRTVAESSYNFVGPSTTKLRQSIVALDEKNPFSNDMAPAKLKPFVNKDGVTVSPLANSFKKFENKQLNELPMEFHEFDVCDGVLTPDKPWDRFRELTLEEAINGVPEWGNCHGIDMDTSAGVGYVNQGLKRKDLFTKVYSKRYEREIYVPKRVVREQYYMMYMDVKAGKIPRCFALGLLKDEKRPKARVEAGASRLFFAACLIHLLVSRTFLGGLISASETNVSQSDIMVGINPLGPEWGLLFDRLTHGGDFKLTSTDIEGWDINFILITVLIFGRALRNFFPDKPSDLIRGVICILWSSVNPFVFIGNKVFWMWIMCSGTLATSWFNSVANSMLHRGLFKIMLKDFIASPQFKEIKDQDWFLTLTFDIAIKAGFFGDDNSQGVHPNMQKIYNGVTLSEYRKRILNWITTDPFKGLEIKEFDTYDTTVLLKRFFRKEGGLTRGPLEKKAIEGIVQWYVKGDNPDAVQQAINMHVAIRESYFWGREYFTLMLTTLQPYLRHLSSISQQDHTFKQTYDELDEQWLSQF